MDGAAMQPPQLYLPAYAHRECHGQAGARQAVNAARLHPISASLAGARSWATLEHRASRSLQSALPHTEAQPVELLTPRMS